MFFFLFICDQHSSLNECLHVWLSRDVLCASFLYPLHLIFPRSSPHHCIPPSPDAKHRAESELGPQTRPRSNTLPKSFGSTLDQGAFEAAGEVKGPHPTREETLELIQRRVKGKRQEDGWPDDIKVRYGGHIKASYHLWLNILGGKKDDAVWTVMIKKHRMREINQ